MKRLLTNLKIKNELSKLIRYSTDSSITIGIYTFEGEAEQDEQVILARVGDSRELNITDYEVQEQPYKININLQKEAKKIVRYLSKYFQNVKYEEAVSY